MGKKAIVIRGRRTFLPISILLVILILLFSIGCALIPMSNIPSPRPGLVLFINSNEWAQGQVLVFEPGVNKENLFTLSGRYLKLQSRPILQVPIPAAPATNIPAISTAVLQPNQGYSLVSLWENKVGQFIKFTYGFTHTSDSAFNQCYTDFLGRQFWADRVIYLPGVSPAEAQPYKLIIRPPD